MTGKGIMEKKRKTGMLESIFVMIIMLYPMRHIHWGLDLWDTGYNYANFEYMGLEHMDSMWLFSTYLSNAMGNLLTKLPQAGSLVGMNLYTGLFVSALALMGYLFFTRKLGIPSIITFIGEMVAISLCWCPTALLYNYLTYVLFLVCVILLYQGLTEKRKWCLFAAGVCLGMNVLVRFSNLPQAAMILAVWAYAFIEGRENRRNLANKEKGNKGALAQGISDTFWCMGGYLAALLLLFGYIHIRYGLDNYFAGIMRLFAMTDNATDYKPQSMVMGIVYTYVENLYWVIRILFIVLAGMLMYGAAVNLLPDGRLGEKKTKWKIWVVRTGCILLALVMLAWLYYRGFCSLEFYSYGSMLRPGILFLMLTMAIAFIRIFHRKSPKEEKLISGMILLVVLLTCIGSNNGVYPSLNNLFLAAPYTLWQCWRFMRNVGSWSLGIVSLQPFPAKCIMTAFLVMFLFQSGMFGAKFVFAEATGVQDVSAVIDNNEVLKGVKMNPERAEWMREISAYVNEHQLQGREVILYGQIPALSYYLQLPSAFNPWSDLRSYSVTQMELDMQELTGQIEEKGKERPIVLAETSYAVYKESGREALKGLGINDERIQTMEKDAKWQLIVEFMEKYGYRITFQNEKITIWE